MGTNQKLTHEEAVSQVTKKHNGTIIPLEPHRKSSAPWNVKCTACQYEWISRHNTLKYKGCPKCSGRIVTPEEAVARIEKNFGQKIKVTGQYKGATRGFPVRCECGDQWAPVASSLFVGQGCPKCAQKKKSEAQRFSHDEASARIKQKFGTKIEVLSQYTGTKSRLDVRCECGHQWTPTAEKLFTGRGCRKCGHIRTGQAKRLTHTEAVERINIRFFGKITVTGQYKTEGTRLDVRCACGHQWAPMPRDLFSGYGCPKCGKKRMAEAQSLSHDEVVARIEKQSGGKISVLGQYKGLKKPISVRCSVCSRQWSTAPGSLLNGNGCAKCSGRLQITQEEAIQRLRAAAGDKIVPLVEYPGTLRNLGK
jgi:Zn finger protein HypA/HybF involved in hydrogenase expression